jgi:hypothetical protein
MSELLSAAETQPEKTPRSKLEKYADAILVLRRKKRYSYVEIADFLLKEAGVEVDPSTVWDFVQAQAKRRRHDKVNAPPPAQEVAATSPVPSPPPTSPPSPQRNRAVYVPPTQPSAAFAPDALKTNDELEEG